jgi:hypothetical protein
MCDGEAVAASAKQPMRAGGVMGSFRQRAEPSEEPMIVRVGRGGRA